MRIFVLSDLWVPFPGGAERLMFNLARNLDQRGEDVRVLTGYHRAHQFDGAPIAIRSLGIREERAQGLADVQEMVAAVEPDVILTHHLYASEYGPALCEGPIPVVQVVLSSPRLPGAALGVFISQWVYNRWGGRDGDVIVTPPAFDDVVAPSHGDAIGFVKPIPHKGVELVYQVAAAMPERRFVVLRGEWQGIELIDDTLPNVEYMEPVSDIQEFYRECRLLLVPSLSEDAGTVAQEATLNGLPCISSAVEGLLETNAGGLQLVSRDPWAWAEAIRMLDDPDLYAACVRRQQEHLDNTRQEDRLADLHQRIRQLAS